MTEDVPVISEAPPTKPKRRYSPRMTVMTEQVLKHLEHSDIDDNLIEMFKNNRPVYFGFDEFQIFSSYELMKKALEFTRSSKFNDDLVLVHQVFVPLLKRKLGDDFPWYDAALTRDVITFAVGHVWNWTDDDIDYDSELESLQRCFFSNREPIRLFVLAALAMPLEVQLALTKCFWLLEVFNLSTTKWIYNIADGLLCKRPYMVMDAMALQPIDNSFARFLKQIFLYRQAKLGIADMRGTAKNRRAMIETKEFTASTISNNFNQMIALTRFRYGSFSYFKECLRYLSGKMQEDFQKTLQPFVTRARICYWMKVVLTECRIGVGPYFKDVKELLLSHFLAKLSDHFNVSVRSGDKLKLRIIAHIPDMIEALPPPPVPRGALAAPIRVSIADPKIIPVLNLSTVKPLQPVIKTKEAPKPDNFAENVRENRLRLKKQRKKQKAKEKKAERKQRKRDKRNRRKDKMRDESPKRRQWAASPVRTLAAFEDVDDVF